ncbi:Retrotransposon nucleocapsid protein, related [Eimeria mitis]|uniref:Retrotransposon nucleocapsid protein, related n=1 Tax=Eimeria mitis TaxID=44415 RepID=U6KD49_9EIME|nr:Retrotransposon nucleocapsid protein, related [Eimeria mitis]CDJ35849.1 Retrotransposon nucleocapsid protein, related [Eimeria mitis]
MCYRCGVVCLLIAHEPPLGLGEQAVAQLRKLKRGKLSIERYIEKYQSLVNRNPMVDTELHYNWFIAGLSPGVRQTVTGQSTDMEMRGEKVELAEMMEYLRRMKLQRFPKSIITDRDPKFVGAFWLSLMQQFSIDHDMTTANHPEADGQTERTNRTLVQYLRLYTQQNSSDWLDFLACAEWVYNTTVHSSTRCSPASLVYTETPPADPPLDLAVEIQPRSSAASDFGRQLAAVRECMRKTQERQARNYDQRRSAVSFDSGDLVLKRSP